MPVERDFAFLVDRAVGAGDLLSAVRSADRSMIAAVDVFDLYQGPGVPETKRSVAIAVTLQPQAKTLTESDLEAVSEAIVSAVERKTGGVLRG